VDVKWQMEQKEDTVEKTKIVIYKFFHLIAEIKELKIKH
jgi:hypothetical protein